MEAVTPGVDFIPNQHSKNWRLCLPAISAVCSKQLSGLEKRALRTRATSTFSLVTSASRVCKVKAPDYVAIMTTDEHSSRGSMGAIHKALCALCVVGTALVIWSLLKYTAYGIDFTDESSYLVWMANPFIYDGSISQFGFIYHPLYKLVGGDIAGLRKANILITFALAWGLVYSFLASLAADMREGRSTLLVVSAGFATSAFLLFDSWLPTPSYNSLTLQALLINAAGLILAEKTANRASIGGWLLIGFGGWLAFMAKPSTALALAVGVFVYLISARKFSIRLLGLAAACVIALLLVCALMIDGSVGAFIKRYQLGIELSRHLGSGHTLRQILRVDEFQLNTKFKAAIFLLSSGISLALWCLCSKCRKRYFFGFLLSFCFFGFTALLTLGQIHRVPEFGQFQGLLIFSAISALAFTSFVVGGFSVLKTISVQQRAITALFLVMPHIYVFGTNGNYWQYCSSAAIFWLLSGLTLIAPLIRERASWFITLPVAVATQTVTVVLFQTGFEHPYRQNQPLRCNASTVEIGPQRSKLMLSEDFGRYFASVEMAAREAGFEPCTPMIDLSGQSPGILYALGAESIGQAWTIGGYSGSLKLAEAALSHTPCGKIAAAWILLEQDGPRSITSDIMSSFGADFPESYELVGTWQTAEGAGGFPNRRTQNLYKPVDQNKTLMTCQKLREEAN